MIQSERINRFRRAVATVTEGAEDIAPSVSRPMSLSAMQAFKASDEGRYASFSDIQRVCDIPLREGLSPDQVEAYCHLRMQAVALAEGKRLFPQQAQALFEYEQVGGVVGGLSVGGGKTLVAFGIAQLAYAKGLRRMVLCFPPQLLHQVMTQGIREARHMLGVNYPVHVLGGKSAGVRKGMSRSGKPGLYILPYSLLSAKDAHEMLDGIKPQIVIADESHHLNNRHSARTRRLMKAIEEFGSELVVLSGTLLSKSPIEHHHLVRKSLGDFCPMPQSVSLATEWSAVIDATAGSPMQVYREMPDQATGGSGMYKPLVEWARKHFPQERFPLSIPGFRKAYQKRFSSTPGVVVSGGKDDLGVSLVVRNLAEDMDKARADYGDAFARLEKFVEDLELRLVSPGGEELSHAMMAWGWLTQLAAGFYSEQYWPSEEEYCRRHPNISLHVAESLLEAARNQHEAEQEYNKALRNFLLEGSPKPGIDTPFLVGRDMAVHKDRNVPGNVYAAWEVARSLWFDGIPTRLSRTVRVCSVKVDAAVKWARKQVPVGKGAILWVHHQEMGRWVYDALVEAGMDALHCPAGDRANREIEDPRNAGKMVVASITAHGTGKNLQKSFSHQYFVQFPRSATMAQQVLGRLHRKGQEADEIEANLCLLFEFEHMHFAACLNDSLFIHQTTGDRQKLIYCNYDPMPRVFPPEVLRERGLDPSKLEGGDLRLLQEKFSTS